ncbi:MAG: hypothetical protein WCG47_03670, partial [Dermatophilaceae bacterium]
VKGGAKQEEQGERPIFKDFIEPATMAGAGVNIKNLYNDYVYFWRWALWRLFEQQSCGGIVTWTLLKTGGGGRFLIPFGGRDRRRVDERSGGIF